MTTRMKIYDNACDPNPHKSTANSISDHGIEVEPGKQACEPLMQKFYSFETSHFDGILVQSLMMRVFY